MPRKGTVTVAVDLHIDAKSVEAILDSVKDVEGTDSQKIGEVALGALQSLAEGGMMLRASLVQRMSMALGRDVQDADVVEKFEAACGRIGDRRVFTISLDPTYVPILEQIATANGIESPAEVIRRDMEDLWDQGHFYQVTPPVRRVVMSVPDYDALKAILGKDFDNGTELAELVKAHTGSEVALFSE